MFFKHQHLNRLNELIFLELGAMFTKFTHQTAVDQAPSDSIRRRRNVLTRRTTEGDWLRRRRGWTWETTRHAKKNKKEKILLTRGVSPAIDMRCCLKRTHATGVCVCVSNFLAHIIVSPACCYMPNNWSCLIIRFLFYCIFVRVFQISVTLGQKWTLTYTFQWHKFNTPNTETFFFF